MHSGEGVDRIKPMRLLPRTLMLQLVGKTFMFLREKCRTKDSLEFFFPGSLERHTWSTEREAIRQRDVDKQRLGNVGDE